MLRSALGGLTRCSSVWHTMNMKTVLYLAKEPGKGVMGDLERLKGHDVTVVACLPGYLEYYQVLGYNAITADQFFSLTDMKFDVVIGNPPYQGTATDSKAYTPLWTKFWAKAFELVKPKGSIRLTFSYLILLDDKRSICGIKGYGTFISRLKTCRLTASC